MLTVTIKSGGTQVTIEAKQVEASCIGEVRYHEDDYDTVRITPPNGESFLCHAGKLYVMNGDGATVAKYDLDARNRYPKGPLVAQTGEPQTANA